MSQVPRDLTPHRSVRHLFGAELRHWRCRRELSQTALAERIHVSPDLISKVEKAQRWPQYDVAEALENALDAGGALLRMWPLVEAEHQRELTHADSTTPHADCVPRDAYSPSPARFAAAFLPHTGHTGRAAARYSANRRWRGDPQSVEELLAMAAHESAEFADNPSNIGPASLEQLRSDAVRLARSFANAPRLDVFTQSRWLRDRAFALLDGRQRIPESRELYFLAGAACGMLAEATLDFGHHDAAMAHTRAALLCAQQAGSPDLTAWIRAEQSNIAYCAGRPQHAVHFARTGQAQPVGGTVSVWLPAQEARSAARLGDAEAARAALARAADARERMEPDDLDGIGGILRFSVPKQHFYATETHLGIGEAQSVVEQAAACLDGYRAGPSTERAYDNEASTQVDLAQALVGEDLAAAREAAQPALHLAPHLRIASLGQRLHGLHARLTEPAVRTSPAAADLREQIEDFLSVTTAPLSAI